MVMLMKDNGKIISFMEKEYISGKMGDNTREIGQQGKWKVEVFILGPMDSNMRDSIFKIKNKAMEATNGEMAEDISETGKIT